MPTEKQFKFGITCEFKPLWDEFESLAPGSKKSKMIRYLIYNFLYNNGNRTQNTFEDATSEDWEYVEGALKVYNKFIKGNTETMKEHVIDKRKFWVENYDHAVKDELVTDEELETLKDEGFTVMRNTIPYYRLPGVDQANDRIVLKKMINEVKHEQITRYLSKPNDYYVKCKWRNNSFSYYEEAYKSFKKEKSRWKRYTQRVNENERPPGMGERPSVKDLYLLNWDLLKKLENNNLLNWDLQKKFSQIDDETLKEYEEMFWEDVPKDIDDLLPLDKIHIQTKKDLTKLRSKETVIYTHYTILEFETGSNPKIIGPRRPRIKNIDAIQEGRFYDE